ncbi:MAG: type II toxin-antitoxin system antitoxin SocA domain-containing protein [Pseudomonadota bacterium]
MKIVDIIRYISWYATENDVALTTNRLVKFLYLVDLYHARLNEGKTLTGLPWQFVYYGPYCGEAMQHIDKAVEQALITKWTGENHFEKGKEYHVFSCKDEEAEELERLIPFGILYRIQTDIRNLGDDTPQLLDYIYFDTEPMAKAQKGDILDFTTVVKPLPNQRVKLKKLSRGTIESARQQIKQLSDKIDSDKANLLRDEEETKRYKDETYHSFIEMLDGEDLDIGLKGTAKIQTERWE